MAKNNAEYWKERFAALENSQYTASEAYCKDLKKQFSKATVKMQEDIDKWYQRLAENNKVSYIEAKKLLDQNQLKEFHWTVEEYIKYGKENGINRKWMKELENASAKVHISRLEAMKLQIQQHAEKLFTEYEGGTSKLLNKTFSSGYYKTAFEVAKGTGVGSDLHKVDTRKIDALIRRPWAQDGASFSDRIWTNKQKLINTLHTELSQNIIRGSDLKTAIANITKTMNVSRSAAETLVRTESAAITSEATKQCYKDLGLEKYEILATLDSKTSDICQDLDGKIFDMKEYEVGVTAPPFHPRCRTTTVPYYEDMVSESEERAARDEETGKTYYVPANLTYKEWEKQFVHKTDKQHMRMPITINGKVYETFGTNETVKEHRKDTPQRMIDLVEQYTQGEYVAINPDLNMCYAYDPINDVVMINPEFQGFENYDYKFMMLHEISHRIDTNVIGSPLSLQAAIKKTTDKIMKNKEKYQKLFDERGILEYNKAISDIFSSLTDNKIKGAYYHPSDYLNGTGNKELEIFANLFASLYAGDDKTVHFIKTELKELYDTVMEVVGC